MSQQTENYDFNLIETTDKITDSLNDLNDNFESLDDILSSIDLSDYYTKTQVDTKLAEKAEKSEVDMITSNNTKTSTKSTALNLTDSLNGLIKDTVIYGNTEQDGTPTPSDPVDVDVVTGDVTAHVKGKNLFDGITENIEINATGTIRNGFIFKGVGTFTLSADYYGSKYASYKIKTDDTYSTYSALTLPFTFTLASNQSLIVYLGGEGEKYKNNYRNTQIEVGSTATSYEPYKGQSQLLSLGNIELAKIGDYQDYIYKNKTSGKWYKHKVTGKLVLDGSENWGYNSTGEYFYVNSATTNAVAWAGNPSTNGFCNRYKCASGWFVKNKQFDYGIGIADNQISVRNINYTDLATFKADVDSNNIVVFYQKSVINEEEITDTTLIAQLEALYNLKTYKPITNVYTTTQNLSPELTIDYEAEQYIKNDVINQIWKGTQTQYDNLGTYSDTTLYLIEEE